MLRNCDSCGEPYEAKRKNSRFCDDKCRKRNQRSPVTTLAPIETPPAPDELVHATEAQLEEAGRLDTVLGQQALTLARRICSPAETGGAIASLSKEFRAVMEAALEGVGVKADPLDELRLRRERKRAAG